MFRNYSKWQSFNITRKRVFVFYYYYYLYFYSNLYDETENKDFDDHDFKIKVDNDFNQTKMHSYNDPNDDMLEQVISSDCLDSAIKKIEKAESSRIGQGSKRTY